LAEAAVSRDGFKPASSRRKSRLPLVVSNAKEPLIVKSNDGRIFRVFQKRAFGETAFFLTKVQSVKRSRTA
jgi:hypothetical protein